MEMTKRGVACVLLLLAVACAIIGPGQAQVSCSAVDSAMGPCAQYLTGQATAPSADCCNGVRSLHSAASSTQARRDTCECLRQVAARYSNLRDEAAQALPEQCGVSVSIPISRNTDCSR
ncbi:Non-specific lipid-transfer protein 4 [Acorus calamus]|uniref:Non-specific lipid-transfer protein n=1 Tax=Acorus calamus TaxID=4465 RepID=A0AAV9E2G7_ACOCL|nr:Non-specific lipid-transfer protein 4 [Acorus calamus]